MKRVIVVGCGVIGASIAYELSQVAGVAVTLLDQQPPAQGSTGAALGVLMGIISQKKRGRSWAMREASIRRYHTLIPELERKTGQVIPHNRDGIVLLQFEGDNPTRWLELIELRNQQGWPLELWNRAELRSHCPEIGECLGDRPITGAVYSAQDGQVDPTALTIALVEGARLQGADIGLSESVLAIAPLPPSPSGNFPAYQVTTQNQVLEAEVVILAAGLGVPNLIQALAESVAQPGRSPQASTSQPQTVTIRPVLGQAMRLKGVPQLTQPDFCPVISGDDIHVVPLGAGEYWVGATVEFPDDADQFADDPKALQQVLDGAIALYPPLAKATPVEQWTGKRPRPWNRPAPIIEAIPGHPAVLLAAGHYRNGVLLAPATAQTLRSMVEGL